MLLAALVCALGLACASPEGTGGGYSYFNRPRGDDSWSYPIARWQAREREAEPVAAPRAVRPPALAGPGTEAPLRGRYQSFLALRRRQLAQEVAAWVQGESRDRYLDDGPVDFWPTFEEALAAPGDDCDGLELLSYHVLRELGFPPGELFRAILHHPRFGQHHMVTLWFETPDDPWVIDPTATVTGSPRRMSEIEDWRPVKVFSETLEYTVRSAR